MREIILELGAEGGSITLYGTRGSDGLRKYHLARNSVALHDQLQGDLPDEEPTSESKKVGSLAKAMALLGNYPSWYKLVPLEVHQDFANRFIQEVSKLGGQAYAARWRERLGVSPSRLEGKSKGNSRSSGLLEQMAATKVRTLYERYLELVRLEVEEFGVKATEVRHLIGRLGEFYCALAVEGSLASTANQHGFDVIAKSGRKISVKATAQKTGFVAISSSTAGLADDLMVIGYDAGELSVIFYGDMQLALDAARHYPEKLKYELDISTARSLVSAPLP